MSTLNVDEIRSQSFIGAPVDVNGIPVTYSATTDIIGIGENALQSCSGPDNVAIGKNALVALTSGDDNTALGVGALQLTTGNNNVGLGRNAGSINTTGTNNVFIGNGCSGSSATASDEITLGNSAHTVIRAAVTTITSLSDERDKKEIQTLPLGLDFVDKLKPVKFVWNDRDENGKHDVEDFGFIAQDLKAVQEESEASYLNLVYDENPDKLEASYGKLLPVLVKAIQEMSTEIKSLKEEIETLKIK
jgi:hypothetical protein